MPIIVKFEVISLNHSGSEAKAVLSTGAEVTVPDFIKVGDMIKVDTVEGIYKERG